MSPNARRQAHPWPDELEVDRDETLALRGQLAEVEGWYRLLQSDHAALQSRLAGTNLRTTALQVAANRLEAENQGLRTLAARLEELARDEDEDEDANKDDEPSREDSRMNRIVTLARAVPRHKWATAAIMTIAALLARDPAVRGVFDAATQRVSQAFRPSERSASEGADSGFLRYAHLLNSREQAEKARQVYNANEAALKGDALLEAQDRLRAAKARYRQARLAFLPELARQCERAGVTVPHESAEALASLTREAAE